jgi:menaquinone-dependent protoporphyrinogen oxidase
VTIDTSSRADDEAFGRRRILVVFATRYGSTEGVAQAVAEQLRDSGCDVDIKPVVEAPGPSPYDAVVIGGPMIRGWHKEALGYAGRYRDELAARPVALFVTAASLTETGLDEVQGVPIVRDPWLAKAPRDPEKLRYKERYALPSHYLGDILDEVQPLRPVQVAFFAGSLDLARMRFLDKLFVLLAVGATPGDGRNWKAIREWAADLPDVLRV